MGKHWTWRRDGLCRSCGVAPKKVWPSGRVGHCQACKNQMDQDRRRKLRKESPKAHAKSLERRRQRDRQRRENERRLEWWASRPRKVKLDHILKDVGEQRVLDLLRECGLEPA